MVKRILQEIKEYKLAALLTPVFMILEVAMEMIIPLLIADLVDKGVEVGNMEEIYRIGGQMLVCALIGLLGGILGAVYGSKASAGLAKNLRKKSLEIFTTYCANTLINSQQRVLLQDLQQTLLMCRMHLSWF